MSLVVHLLGRPRLERGSGEAYQFRSRKSWALLAYLVLHRRAPARSQLAELLFSGADDPLRALRWSLTEIRRGLGEDGSVEGDPVSLRLSATTVVDVELVTRGSWTEVVALPGIDEPLLDGGTILDAPAYATWLLSEQRRLAAAAEAILHEAALGSLSRGALGTARDYAVRAAAMSPLDENHQALLVRLYRLAGDHAAAQRQYDACAERLRLELGVPPGAVVEAALREVPYSREPVAGETAVQATVEAGSAAVSAGATEAGIQVLRTAVRLADDAEATELRVSARLVLAEALVHSLRGLDEEGLATLFAADEIAVAHGLAEATAQARTEIGYVDFLRARYDRAEIRLEDALRLATGSPALLAKATTYLGSMESDRSDYPRARRLLEEAVDLSRRADDPRMEAYALAMLGRLHLLRGDLVEAATRLDASIGLAERCRWLAFLAWPQALLGEVRLGQGDVTGARDLLEHAFARACQVGDPCWEGMAGHGLALVAASEGDPDAAFALLADARVRAHRFADPYVWLEVQILDAQCRLGLRHGHENTAAWIEQLTGLASRSGMREQTVRALLHAAALGDRGSAAAATLMAADIDNPVLRLLVEDVAAAQVRSGLASAPAE